MDAANQRVILENARALMTRDPTAAYELLQTYRGGDATSLAILQAEAVGSGVSVQHLRPDGSVVYKMYPILGGIVREDKTRRISKMTAYGTVYLLVNAWAASIYAQAEKTSVIAYRCEGDAICLFDTVAERHLKPPAGLSGEALRAAAIDPAGTLLATLAASQVSIWRLSSEGALAETGRVAIRGGESIAVLNGTTVWVSDDDGIAIIDVGLHVSRLPGLPRGLLRIAHDGSAIVLGTRTGEVVVIDPTARRVATRRSVCGGAVSALPLSRGKSIAFYCENDSIVSVWDSQRDVTTPLGVTSRAFASSLDDRYLYVGTSNGELLIYDAMSGTLQKLLGHASSISAVAAPSAWYPYIVTNDSYGNTRSWKPPGTPVVDQLSVRISWRTGFVALPDGSMLVEDASPMAWYPNKGPRQLLPESTELSSQYLYSRTSTTRHTARFGNDDVIKLWDFDAMWRYRELRLRIGVIRDVVFGRDPNTFLAFSRDGAITRWSLHEASSEILARLPEPLFDNRPCPGSERSLLITASEQGWMFDGTASLRWTGRDYEHLAIWACAPGGRWEGIAETTGDAFVRNLDTHQKLTIARGVGSIMWMAFSADGTEVAIVTETEVLFRQLPGPDTIVASQELAPVRALPRAEIVRPEFVTYSPDNRWIAITADHGAVWFYRRTDARWVFVSVGEASATRGQFTSDSARFFVKDSAGKAHVIDMTAAMFR